MGKPHTTTVVAVIVSTVGILVTVKGWTGTAGATATWFAIAAAIYGSGIAARNLKHAQEVAHKTDLDRETTRIIDRRTTAIEAMTKYVNALEIFAPTMNNCTDYVGTLRPIDSNDFEWLPEYVHRPPFQLDTPYPYDDSDTPPYERVLDSNTIAVHCANGAFAMNGFVDNHYPITYASVRETALESVFANTIDAINDLRRRVVEVSAAVQNGDQLTFAPNRDEVFSRLLEPITNVRAEFLSKLRSEQLSLDGRSIRRELERES